ncbi:MAG: hypothetical protein C4B59_08800 [Candidatus Methanogaster sp.]|uniref:Uncharacterized protein n=1 Tax=Candidatus Methanogaster sp. TaxID=3386292 RepID=A0AC61L2Z9_9EURY|nr:MAG: hypothetical protein C4B59_08800 [ANME-2 cluster archaeon]
MPRSKRTRRKGLLDEDSERSPLSGVANIFDVAMVFSVALIVMLVVSYNMPQLLDPDADLTVVTNPGQPDMQIIIKEGQTIEVMNMTNEIAGGEGEVLGTAYKLANGKVIYVPKDGNESS